MSSQRPLSRPLRRRRAAGTLAAVATALLLLGLLGASASASSRPAPAPGQQAAGEQQAAGRQGGPAEDPGPVDGPTPAPVTSGRLAGADRIGTAVAISQRAFPAGAPAVYLTRADEQADAVAAGSLADGPILLVGRCTLPDAVAEEIRRLAPSEVIALGGPAAVCDDVLDAATAAATPGDGGQDLGDHTVTVTAEVRDVTGPAEAPFTVEVADVGQVVEGGTYPHDITITATDGTVTLDDPRFAGVIDVADGRMVLAGRGCGPNATDDGDVVIACTDDLQLVTASPSAPAVVSTTLHTDDAQAGDVQLQPGTYVLDQPVRFDLDDPQAGTFDDGTATIRLTYVVTRSGDDDPTDSPADAEARRAVVTWETPEGTFRTDGHDAADLDRIRRGAADRTHIGIPNGAIHRGDGGVNVGHDWHLTDVELADVTMEVCDGTAAYVDANLEDFLAIGRYCPWGAVPLDVTS